MKPEDWASRFSAPTEWGVKKVELVREPNRQFGDGFATVIGDLVRLTSKGGKVLDVRAVSPTEYRLGEREHLELANSAGTPVPADKLIYHIGNFANGSVE